MSEHSQLLENRRFGLYLRSVREDRKLSLDAVEEMSMSYRGRLTKSHLSRIENGHAEPSFPRMFALSKIYGVPLSSMAEHMEREMSRAMAPDEVQGREEATVLEEAEDLRKQGRYEEALLFYDALIDRSGGAQQLDENSPSSLVELMLARAVCLTQLSRMGIAREEIERLLGLPNLDQRQRATAMFLFVHCCFHTSRFTIAQLAIAPTEALIRDLPDNSRLRAKFASLKGVLWSAMGRNRDSCDAHREALGELRKLGDRFEACRARINYASALMDLGKYREAKRNLQIALRVAEENGYERLIAFALSTLGVVAYREHDLKVAEAYCLKSNAVARIGEFASLIFQNSYYLWRIASARQDGTAIRSFERTLRKYVSRLPDYLTEVVAYREHLTGSEE